MANPDRTSPGGDEETYREIVGIFRSSDALESAISELSSAGWDRSEMSLLAQHGILVPEDVEGRTSQLADDERAQREAVLSEPDVRQGRTLAAGMAGVVGAFIASGATIMTGGTALAAIVGAAVAGGGAAGAVDLFGQRLSKGRGKFLHEQIEHGGILLWARLRSADQEEVAREILARHGATDVHIHELETAAGPDRRGDEVEEASLESFPASDPPAWTGAAAGVADVPDIEPEKPAGRAPPRR